jgi:predicted Fe-S protein YdhL (DUF1289 family)
MINALYHFFGLDGSKIVNWKSIEAQARQDVLKHREKRERKAKKGLSE